ncbi:MAG TPA: RluA family pseudouridine synthase [Thermoanaerobaculia bacterium]|jgi:23S rRNA pseudouridine1911/1915/1917 synthase|nr:RluA family pseudouridine synthase [Thermoanaerobaculia bacterium]
MPEESRTVAGDQAGATLAAVVREMIPGTSWSQAKEMCSGGRVTVDGVPAADPARRMSAGELVEIRLAGSARREPAVTDLVVHLDGEVAVVRKPAGILTVPFERDDRDTLVALARVAVRRIDAARGRETSPTLRTVQRLDKETSGLVVFARSVPAQRHLQRQLAEHTVLRRYLAIAHGTAEDAVYETMFVPDRGDGLRGSWGVFRPGRSGRSGRGEAPAEAREAITRVQVLERLPGATLLACELETGRQHQIRIHLAEAGHPLVGETVYVRDYLRDSSHDQRGPLLPAPRPMLHAAVLGFVHPRTEKVLRFEEPPPDDFTAVLKRLRAGKSRQR